MLAGNDTTETHELCVREGCGVFSLGCVGRDDKDFGGQAVSDGEFDDLKNLPCEGIGRLGNFLQGLNSTRKVNNRRFLALERQRLLSKGQINEVGQLEYLDLCQDRACIFLPEKS